MKASGQMLDLKVRSKRKRRDSQATTASTIPTMRKRRGRPMKAASELKSRILRVAPSKASPPARMRSWLERLPAELIQQIFLHALEPNMAKASPILGRMLSNETIYRVLILFAFCRSVRRPEDKRHFAPAVYRFLICDKKASLQRGILECRWCTLSRVRQCLPFMMRLGVFQAWLMGHNSDMYGEGSPAMEWQQWQQWQLEQGDGPLRYSPQPSSLSAINNFKAAYAYYSDLNNTACIRSNIAACLIHASMSVYYFPSRLLNPESWHDTTTTMTATTTTTTTDGSPVDLLTLLLHGWTEIGTPSPPWEHSALDSSALFDGLKTAVRERHWQAIELLLRIYDKTYRFQTRSQNFYQKPAIPRRVLHLATRQGEDSFWILDLLTTGPEYGGQRMRELPRDDRVLTKWAIKQAGRIEQRGGRFAKWLLKMMEE